MSEPVQLHPIESGVGNLILATERSAVTVTRVRAAAVSEGTVMAMTPQNAQVLVYQFNDHPAHDLWLGGKHVAAPPLRSGQMNLVDVRDSVSARTKGALDSLHILLPGQALADLTSMASDGSLERLHAPAGWMTRDPMVGRLAPMLVQALSAEGLSKLYVDHLIWGVVAHLTKAYGVTAVERRSGGLAAWQVKRAQAVMDESLGRSITLVEIASACGLSVAHFSRGYKQATGVAPHAWLQARRMDKARTMLARKDLSIVEVAQACGFGDQSHFSRLFKRKMGAAPMAWRRLNQDA